MNRSRVLSVLLLISIIALSCMTLSAQNIISGELVGTVTDASNAVVPGATVTLKNAAMGINQTTTTTATGLYRFPLLRPGTYTVTVEAKGFAPITRTAVVSLGQVADVPVTLAVSGGKEVVQVNAEQSMLQVDNGNTTTNYSEKQVAMLPSPGLDLTNYILSAPGVVLSTGAGYGNFTANGMPGTSNSYTVNGSDYNDPFNGLNNSGASNNMLGTNELQEMTVVTNGYTGQYGRSAGASVNYTTQAGTNQFHGNANWYWNGSKMNANDWYNNNTDTPRPFANSNMWGGRIGGPIKKDKLFFFFDSEGMRYILPSGGPVYVPNAAFQAATLANVPIAERAFYQNIFNLYNGAPGSNLKRPVTAADDSSYTGVFGTNTSADGVKGPGCGSFSGFALGASCADQFQAQAGNKNVERLMTARVDWNPRESDKFAFRYVQDRGLQATYTDPINSVFNAQSVQPQDSGQMTYTKIINNRMVNQLILSGSYYSAIFNNPDRAASLAAFPTTLIMRDGMGFSYLGGENYSFPQGRRVAQIQAVDDFSWTTGNHNFKFGANIRQNKIADLTPFRNTSGELEPDMADFFNGYASTNDPNGVNSRLIQRYENSNVAHFSLYSLGLYIQDQWKVSNKLSVTLSLRADRNTNTSCASNCFDTYAGGAFVPAAATVPYNQSVMVGQSQAFHDTEAIVLEPRFGFAWTPFGKNTVIRGGVGLFTDLYPAQLAEAFVSNMPYVTSFTVPGNSAGTIALAPGIAGGLFANAASSYSALLTGYPAGQTYAQIKAAVAAAGGTYSAPSLTVGPNQFQNPKYLQWNLEIQHSIGEKTGLKLNYVGNHGYQLFMQNPTVNAYCPNTHVAANPPTPAYNTCPGGMSGIAFGAAPDTRFGTVTQYTNTGLSNYNGLTGTITRRLTKGFTGSLNYTWSHSIDTVSNAGLESYNTSAGGSLLFLTNPANKYALNYSNSDYDFRHTINANYVWELPFKAGNKGLNAVVKGWSVSGTLYARSGAPFSVYNSVSTNIVANATGEYFMAAPNTAVPMSCTSVSTACFSASQFFSNKALGQQGSWGYIARNSFRGPGYFNTDMSIDKKFRLSEKGAAFSVGANFFNLLNHPNFNIPSGNLASGAFGSITSTVTPASSPYGNFQGAAVSGRLIQTHLKFEF